MRIKNQQVPAYTFGEPNQPVILEKYEASIKDSNGHVIEGNAEIRLDLLPEPLIIVHFISKNKLEYSERVNLSLFTFPRKQFELELTTKGKQINVFFEKFDLSDPNESTIDFVPFTNQITVDGDDNTKMQYVYFLIFNFKKIRGKCDRAHLEDDNWIIELEPHAKSKKNFEVLENEGGYGLTHIGCLRKKDNSVFLGKEVKDIFFALKFFFSFAKGTWCTPVCPEGFDSSGKVWNWWATTQISGFSKPYSWFCEFEPEQLENYFPCFMSKWNDRDWNDTYRKVIYWYLLANNVNIDAGIILAQTALERLSYEHFKGKSDAPAKKDSASKKLDKLFSPQHLNIPTTISVDTPKLKRLAEDINNLIDTNKLVDPNNWNEKMKWKTTPYAMTGMRNSLIHPENFYNSLNFGDAMLETWQLYLWYIEVSLLKLCDYYKKYSNRLTAKCTSDSEYIPRKKIELYLGCR